MFDLMSKKKYFFGLSIFLILIGFVFFLVNGVQLDIQFQGGTRVMIETTTDAIDTELVEKLIQEKTSKQVNAQVLKTYNPEDKDASIFMLRIDVASKESLSDETRTVIVNTIKENIAEVKKDGNVEMLSVDPMIGSETLKRGLQAALIASILIILYVAWRFSVMAGFSAALMAIVALLHDAAIMFSVYTVFKLPLNEVFIAAILTILGYSLNDTIIIYDRIRENTKLMRKSSLDQIVNTSVMQTLARSINTTVTTLICLIVLYIFASINNISSLREFSLPLIVGMTSGAYSSIFVASPLWMMWRQSSLKKRIKRA